MLVEERKCHDQIWSNTLMMKQTGLADAIARNDIVESPHLRTVSSFCRMTKKRCSRVWILYESINNCTHAN